VQERLLAQRVLHFTKDQLLWECRSNAASETHPATISTARGLTEDSNVNFKRLLPET